MRFQNKRILVICKETYSYPLYYLSCHWMANNQVAAFFINPSESQYNKCLLNDTTFYKFKELGIPVYTSDDIARDFTLNLHNPKVEYDLLSEYEKKYSHYKTFNEQILSTQYFTRHYHYRNYMQATSYEQQMYWLQLNYVNVERIIEDFNPDLIIDTDCAELGRTILAEIAYSRSIPYMTLEYPRFETYKLITFQLGYGPEKYVIKKYDECNALDDKVLSEEIEYVKSFRKQETIMSKEFKGDVTATYHGFSFIEVLRRMRGHIHYFTEQDIISKNLKLKKSNPILYPNSYQYIKFNWKYYLRKNKLMKENKYFSNPVDNEKYVYMPLHLIPESSTFVKAPYYIDEYNIIEAVSKALPIGWRLYVKEHQAMVGERGEDFYKRVNKLPNVRMVQINYYQDPKPWIDKCQAVVTITGTSAYEAALMGKHAIVFGDIPFSIIEGIHRINSFESLPALFRTIESAPYISNEHSCAAYIKAIKEIGEPINIKILLNEALDNLRNNIEPSEEYKEELSKLCLLYEKAYSYFLQ